MTDIYAAPDADLVKPQQGVQYSTLEKGIAGDYNLSVGDVLDDAWKRVKGAKGSIFLALILLVVINICVSFALMFALTLILPPMVVGIVQQVLLIVLLAPMNIGVGMMGIRCAVDADIKPFSIFSYYDKIAPLAITHILMYLLIGLGTLCLILPGIYLMVSYALAPYLVVEKGLSPWQALEASRKAITKKWFTFFGIGLVLMLVFLVAMIPLGIGLIWVAPLGVITLGVIYRNVFGVEDDTINS